MEEYEVIIIGGGPAGLSASIYSARAGFKTLILEMAGLGGQMLLIHEIENYPGFPKSVSGFELQDYLTKQGEKFGMTHKLEMVKTIKKVDDKFIVKTDENEYSSLSVIIATGAASRKLGIPGEGKFIGKGVSYCGVCDGMFFRDKDVIVVGGGDTALTEAAFLTKFAKSITIIHRRDRFRAIKYNIDMIKQYDKISTIFDSVVTEIKGDEKVKSVLIQNVKTDEIIEKTIDGIFVFVGLIPNSDFLPTEILDNKKYVVANNKLETNINGLFVAGDVKSGAFRQVVTACADGATAADNAGKYIDALRGQAYI